MQERAPKLEQRAENNLEQEWKEKYEQFITRPESEKESNLDLLIFEVPMRINSCDSWPKEVRPVYSGVDFSSGLAQLATQVQTRGRYKVGIFYGDSVSAVEKGTEKKSNLPDFFEDPKLFSLSPKEAARMAISSSAKVIGLSLIVASKLSYAKEIIEETKRLAEEINIQCPEFIVGGPQASLDRERTAEKLGIELEQVIPGRAFEGTLQFLDKNSGETSDYTNIDSPEPFNPEFIKLPVTDSVRVNLDVISTGGETCISREACQYCTAYFLGERREIPLEVMKQQIDLLSENGVQSINAKDNFINLAKKEERDRFLKILKYLKEKNMFLHGFSTRPDILAATPIEYLREIKELGVKGIFLGIESGNFETIQAMGRSNNPKHYIDQVIEACEKVASLNFSMALNVILAYPVDNINGKEADRQTLNLLTALIKIIYLYNRNDVLIGVSTFLPYPGSPLTHDLIQRGATQDNLDKYIEETSVLWRNLMMELTTQSQSLKRILLIGRGGRGSEMILDFFQERRKALNSLLSQPYHYLDQ